MIPFSQVDVFSADPFRGNPVAVFHCDGTGVTAPSDGQMATIANWTNLSETTFLLPPTEPGADYRVRIFTPSSELPFAGHPTLGTARAWLEAGGVPATPGTVVQECGIGLVELRESEGRLAFVAPEFLRTGEVDRGTRARVLEVLDVPEAKVEAMHWIDNGPGWLGVCLSGAADVLALEVDPSTLGELHLGVFGSHGADPGGADPGAAQDRAHPDGAHPDRAHPDGGGPADCEVRAFAPGIAEDPVTGSLNAGFARWLIGEGLMPDHYVAAQGSRVGRSGRVHIDREGDRIWVGGAATVILKGQARIG